MTTTREQIVENWNHPVRATDGKNLTEFLLVRGDENHRIEQDIKSLYEQTKIESATGEELERIGDYVNVTRKAGEGDEKLRLRIRAEFIAQASDTSYIDFLTGAAQIVGVDTSQIEIERPPTTPAKVIRVKFSGSVADSLPFSNTELESLLNKMISVDARIEVVRTGTFAFAGDDSSLEGWDEGTWSSTIIE